MDYQDRQFSHLWTVHLGDFERGLIVAICTTPLTIIYDSLSAGAFTLDWKKILAAAVIGGIGYLLKNLFTGANGNVLTNK